MTAKADDRWMSVALSEARKGTGAVHPNPLVGAAVVRSGRLVSVGHHARFGATHAEAAALEKAGRKARGATLYVTLEPCDHHGKTPPCTRAIREAGIRRVVVADDDPHPLVRGRGYARLRRSGLRVERGISRSEARLLNEDYRRWVLTGLPFVTLKLAQTLDGKIATRTGRSRWISGPEARVYAHGLRAVSDAVLVGARTVRMDDPGLDVRLGKAQAARARRAWGMSRSPHAPAPLKVVVDAELSLNERARLFRATPPERIVLAVTRRARAARIRRFRRKARVWVLPADARGRVRLRPLLRRLAREGCLRVLAEGGGRLAASLLAEGLVSRLCLITAPMIFGGTETPSVAEMGVRGPEDGLRVERLRCRPLGGDLLIEGEL